jgi:hypothetical protein
MSAASREAGVEEAGVVAGVAAGGVAGAADNRRHLSGGWCQSHQPPVKVSNFKEEGDKRK